MIKKGDQTRAALLETAQDLFAEKGFSAVTMQDFCDRQSLSRGGLYRYFSSTQEIFRAMLDADKENSAAELEEAIAAGIPARQLFAYFLDAQKQAVRAAGGRLSIAVYEFCISHPDQKGYLTGRFAAAVAMLETLIRYGQARGEFLKGDAQAMASHIVVFLEGLKLSSTVIDLSEDGLERQMSYLVELVLVPPASKEA